jgi:hypothetical protein
VITLGTEDMQRHTHEWLNLNRRLFRAAEKLCEKIRPVATKAQFECICYIFLERGAKTLRAVNVLYENKLDDQGQALIRILIENWINFSWFIRISDSERERGIQRFWDALNLDYFKQLELQRESDMDDSPIMQEVRAKEAEIRARYSKEQFKSLQKYGFTLRSIEQRMRELGYWTYYRYFFRPISRSIHASDHLELRARLFDPNRQSPIEDTCFALAQWSLWGICDELNRRGRLDAGKKLAEITLALGRLIDATGALPKRPLAGAPVSPR